jgi:hypothetical protein
MLRRIYIFAHGGPCRDREPSNTNLPRTSSWAKLSRPANAGRERRDMYVISVASMSCGSHRIGATSMANNLYGSEESRFRLAGRKACDEPSYESLLGSTLLFSFGFTVERTTMNLFSVSNQKGAPSDRASVVISQPIAVSP